jgi:predicted phosphoadenosine phosphosulfate sulfurtransferase
LLEWQGRRGDMDLSEVNTGLEKVTLPGGQKKAILLLIDAKINQDMKEVISEIRQLEAKIQMTEEKIQITAEKHSNEIKTVYWVIGIAMAVILFVVARR